ncbi:MAG: TRC40/GET3/ArsA family transport-energizing ATPase [Gemmatimonadales bacterium]|nr:TRC40/GET3/ArsA family transport-energizing ATPase [Gemmatimonadales bacterium]NIR00286.1 TRC40/GET3/ArsA family transport-energizing ATPase [Gemmatimonadales bacterium]NIS64619.1 TRC40/GET3/ArsA family transport-energizing ATPase [Gemmatimonadales bacterium]
MLFFGGKGGVGKTTLASAFALLAAERGHRTLLVSTDPAHSTADILETEVGPEPRQIMAKLWAMEIDPAREADRYISEVKQRIADTTPPRLVAEVERQIDIARVTPGAEEAALFERFTKIMEDAGSRYDRILFDTAPLGQTLRLLSLPELMTAWMGGLISRRKKVNVLGRMWRTVAGAAAGDESAEPDPVLVALEQRKARFLRARERITDDARTAFVFVAIPERLPLLETEKAVAALAKYDVPVGAIVVNRVLPDGAEGAFLARRREREADLLAQLHETYRRYPVYRVPQFDTDVHGFSGLRRVIAELPPGERMHP